MTFEHLLAHFVARGYLLAAQEDVLRDIYKEEMTKHGDDVQARGKVADFLSRTDEERREDIIKARAVLLAAVVRNSVNSPSVPIALQLLQAIVGALIGSVVAAGLTLMAFYMVMTILDSVFGTFTSHVRFSAKGVLAGLIAAIAGAISGGMLGWKFNARVAADKLRQFLGSATILERAWISMGSVWTSLTFSYFALHDPFGRRTIENWRVDDALWFANYWIGPLVGVWLASRIVMWVANGRRE